MCAQFCQSTFLCFAFERVYRENGVRAYTYHWYQMKTLNMVISSLCIFFSVVALTRLLPFTLELLLNFHVSNAVRMRECYWLFGFMYFHVCVCILFIYCLRIFLHKCNRWCSTYVVCMTNTFIVYQLQWCVCVFACRYHRRYGSRVDTNVTLFFFFTLLSHYSNK